MNYRRRRSEEQIISTLLSRIWGLTPPASPDPDALNKYEARSYFDHYKDLLYDASLIQEEEITLGQVNNQCEQVAELVRIVQENWTRPIGEIKDAVVSSGHPPWLVRQHDRRALSKSVDFAVRLWLFVPLHVDKITRKRGTELTDAMTSLDAATIQNEAQRWIPPRLDPHGTLSFDFTVENLVRKAGLVFRPTSFLGQHLVMEDFSNSTVIHVFRHVRALEKYQYEAHSDIYPDGFLDEVCRTTHLLFPIKDPRSIRRTKHLARRYNIDVETGHEAHIGLGRLAQLDLASYPYFGERLKDLQDRYNKATPESLGQLWFDRRKPVEWAILWVALVVFILTVIFGIIGAVAGIMQVMRS